MTQIRFKGTGRTSRHISAFRRPLRSKPILAYLARVSPTFGQRTHAYGLVNLPSTIGMTVRYVVFDLGGVLIRIHHNWQDCLKALGITPAIAEQGLESLETFRDYQLGAVGRAEYVRQLAGYLSTSEADAYRCHMAILREEFEDVSAVVGACKALGVGTACFSNTNESHWEELLNEKRFPVMRSIDVKLASHVLQSAKPDDQSFRSVLEVLGTVPEETLLLDDTEANVSAARRLGWLACHVNREEPPATQIVAALRSHGIKVPLVR